MNRFAAFAIVALGAPLTGPSRPQLTTLRIESMSRLDVKVHVTSNPAGIQSGQSAPALSALDIAPPATVYIADSVRSLHVVVAGFVAVRVELFDGRAASDTPIVSEGRDITLSRAANGRFRRIWTVQPLVP